jgi:RNA polymerase sigma factor (sigma-70 family)
MDWEQIYHRLASDTNDAEAWAALERRARIWARAVFWKHGRDAIEDVVADTCAAIALGLSGARGAETFAGYAYGQFLNARRRMLRNGLPSGVPLGTFDIAAPLEEDELDTDSLMRLRHALATLPQRERTAVTMRYFHELSSASIATELGVTDGNARRILFNGLRRLRSKLSSRHRLTGEGAFEIGPLTRVTRCAGEAVGAPGH